MKKVYIAGPMCFDPEHDSVYKKIKELCSSYKLEIIIPSGMDREIQDDSKPYTSSIYGKNIKRLESADAVIANISPFRGPSADTGTVFEVAWALAKGKPVFVYNTDERQYRVKVEEEYSNIVREYHGHLVDHNFQIIEDFGLLDNIMLVEPFRVGKTGRDKFKIFKSLKEAVIYCRQYFINKGEKEEPKEVESKSLFKKYAPMNYAFTVPATPTPLRASVSGTLRTATADSAPTFIPTEVLRPPRIEIYDEPEPVEVEYGNGCSSCDGLGCPDCD